MTRATVFLTVAILILSTAAIAATPAPKATTTEAPPAVTAPASDDDSHQVRDEFRNLLNQYPPEVGTVLKLDPTLFNNPAYIANYPALAEFVSRHPGIAHNPAFYLESVPGLGHRDPESPSYRMWMQTLGAFGGFAVFLIVTYVLVWMVKTLIEQRRWSRLARMQTEVHGKLLDRFTSNEELLAYVQTPAGKRFLESGPILLEAGPRPMSAPVGRIFGSLQAGLVIGAAGVGIDVASYRFDSGVSGPLFAMAIIAICVGAALVLSAGAFYAISRRVGLWQAPPVNADAAAE